MNFWPKITKPIIGIAPMDGITDASFRYVTAKHGGPDVTLTEFVNIQSAFYSPHTLLKDFTYGDSERPVVAQIYGKTPELFYRVAHIVCEMGFDGLDINMGCPARKVAASGCGAALTRAPALAREIIRAVKRGIQDWYEGRTVNDAGLGDDIIEEIKLANRRRAGYETPRQRRVIPVSVKTRLGYDRNVIEEWLPTLLEENLAAISLHGRTLEQGYKGEADWDAIGRAVEIAKGSSTLILGNGDIHDLRDAYRRVRETRVDGVLIGRGAQGNPWLFRDKDSVKQALRTNSALVIDSKPVSLSERFQVIMEHSNHFENLCGPSRFMAMRKHLTWYCCNFRGAAEMRAHMTRANSAEEVRQSLMKYAALIDDDLNSSQATFDNRESTVTAASSSPDEAAGFTS
jgi:nifR3 family TIM-barrel protein